MGKLDFEETHDRELENKIGYAWSMGFTKRLQKQGIFTKEEVEIFDGIFKKMYNIKDII